MAKRFGVVDQNYANRLQPIDPCPRIGLTQFQRCGRYLSEESVTRFKLREVPPSLTRRHDPTSRARDLHPAYICKIRAIRRHGSCNTRIYLDFTGMPRIWIRYPDERQTVARVQQAGCVRSARTKCRERHHMVCLEKSADLLPEFNIHNSPTPRFGTDRSLPPYPPWCIFESNER